LLNKRRLDDCGACGSCWENHIREMDPGEKDASDDIGTNYSGSGDVGIRNVGCSRACDGKGSKIFFSEFTRLAGNCHYLIEDIACCP